MTRCKLDGLVRRRIPLDVVVGGSRPVGFTIPLGQHQAFDLCITRLTSSDFCEHPRRRALPLRIC